MESNENKGCGFLFVIIVGIVLIFGGCVAYVTKDDDSPSYYDSDDYDTDGDVDYDDVNKYLNDSLEDDINDGDDW